MFCLLVCLFFKFASNLGGLMTCVSGEGVKVLFLPPEAIKAPLASLMRACSLDNKSYLNVNLRWPVGLISASEPYQEGLLSTWTLEITTLCVCVCVCARVYVLSGGYCKYVNWPTCKGYARYYHLLTTSGLIRFFCCNYSRAGQTF